MSKEFVHLHLHTDYSLLDGAIKIGPLARKAAALGMPAVAMTDHGNLFGALSFYHKMREAGVKPIIGMEGYIARGSRHDKGGGAQLGPGERATNHIVLLARNLTGYHNLVKLSSFAFTEGFWRKPRFDRELLAQYSEGLIGLSACLSGVPQTLLLQDKFDEAARAALEFEEILGPGNYFLELMDHGLAQQLRILKPMAELAKKTGIPAVVSNDSHYLNAEDVKAHDCLLCISTGKTINDPGRLSYGSPKYYFRPAEEMWADFGEQPEWLLNTLRVAEMCNLEFPKAIDQVPLYPVPEDHTIESYFEKVARAGFDERFRENWQPLEASGSLRHSLTKYQERLSHEIATIKKMGFPGYFLIVWDFIRYARERGIPVGPGRGSAAGSLVAYCLKITDVDPMQYDLLFERFLNPERVSMPDIDVDFCVRGRGDVINYVSDLYGRQNVAQIITFGTMASRAAIKDVGRALEMPYSEVEKVAKLIPPPIRGRNVSIEDAIKMNSDLKQLIENDEKVSELIDIARKLEGASRHTSVHAAGVVISPKPIHELVPVCVNGNNELTTQFVMSDLEKTGMLKMDFLALTTLTIIEDCLKFIEQDMGERLDLAQIPLNDTPALKLFEDGLLNAVFQFESCLSGETKIGGSERTIKDLYNEVARLKAQGEFGPTTNRSLRLKSCYVDEGEFHSNGILDVVATGVKPVYRVITEGNFTIKATADHYFLTERGWVKLGELDPVSDKVLFKPDSYYAARVGADGRVPWQTNYRRSVRCKACAARLTSNPSQAQAREKISPAHRGKRPGNYPLSTARPAYDECYSVIVRGQENQRGKSWEEIFGAERAAVLREEASDHARGVKNPRFGRLPQGASAYSAAGFRDDLGHYVRSTWEADLARVLKYCGLAYEYEPRRFLLVREDGTPLTYAPDFYVPAQGKWYEIKGWLDDRRAEKIRLFQAQYPAEELIVIDRTRFAEFQMQFRDLVQWECPKTPPQTLFLKIEQITYVGEEETYDIKMRPPGNNFLANGFIVHNSGMVEICRKLKPESLEDLSALNALYRPGPLDGGMVDDYIERRHGRRKVTYIVPQMKEILENTYGILVYQEQIMQLAQKLAGYSLGEADLMRRAMGKKKKEEMAKHEEKFVSGAVERGIAKEKAEKIFSLMAQFADYGFNRSHSFAYAYLAYHTAYLKANYPTHFYAAVLTSEGDNTEKVARYISEMRRWGFSLLPPDINSSHQGFTPVGGAVRFGLAAIKGVGEAAVQAILRAREAGGAFKSIFDLAERVDARAVNKRVYEAMIKAGALDELAGGTAEKRAALLASLDRALEQGAKTQRDRDSGQIGMFDLMPMAQVEPELPATKPWSKKEQLNFEKETLGFYASGHPLEDYAAALQGLANVDGGTISEHPPGAPVTMGGLVIDLALRTTKKGDRFALLRLEDQFSSVKIVVWPEPFTKYKTLLENDRALLIKGKLEVAADGAATLIAQEIQPLEGARAAAASGLTLRLTEASLTAERVAALRQLFNQHTGHAAVTLEVGLQNQQTVKIRPQQFLRVKISPELEAALKAVCADWEVTYIL